MDVAAMNAAVKVNEYDFVFRDPVQYTLIVIKRDPTELLVGAAAILMLLGIFMAFYWRPVYETADEKEKEEGQAL